MSIVGKGWGSGTFGFNTTITPIAPSFAISDALILLTGEFAGTNATPATPAGWTLLSDTVGATHCVAFGLSSLTGSESMPSFTWGNQWSWAVVGVYSGVSPTLTAPFVSGSRTATSTQVIAGPSSSRLPNVDGSLVIFGGEKNTAQSSISWSAPSNFSLQQFGIHSGAVAFAVSDWIQTTATTVAANLSLTGSPADSTSEHCEGLLFALAPAQIYVPSPPMSRGGIGVQMCQ